jgi:hypothetical protein
MEKVNRRNLSGVYLFYQFPDEDRREPTVFEDCPEDKQDEWLNSIDPEAVKSLAKTLGQVIRSIGDQMDLMVD